MPGARTYGSHGDGARQDAPAQVVDVLRRETFARLGPLLGETVRGERARLAALQADAVQANRPAPAGVAEALTNLAILGAELMDHEQRWQKSLGEAFAAWPHPPAARVVSGFALVSDDELQAQLIGQPVAEALDKRFAYVRDVIDKRLLSLAARLQTGQRPTNPMAPQHVVDAFLAAFTPQDCTPGLRQSLLRHHEKLLESHLGPLYEWCNAYLAEAGHAMASGNDHASLVARGGNDDVVAVHGTGWERGNVVAATDAAWQRSGSAHGAAAGDGPRGALLRTHARRVRTSAQADRVQPGRFFRQAEFMSTLGLLQADGTLPGPAARHSTRMRAGLYAVAGQLGIEQRDVDLTPEQDDAIDVVGRLFDALAARHMLSPEALRKLSILTLPYLYFALEDPRLFDDPPPPAMQLLSQLLELWDGADPDDAAGAHALADRVADEIVRAAPGDVTVFARGLAQIDAGMAPVRRRAEAGERRTWQAIRGRERLDAARRDADAALRACLQGREVLDATATFLDAQWRQALVQTWLRDGAGSPRHEELRALGDALVGTDALALRASGDEIADRLLAILPALRTCCRQCGLDEAATEAQIAALVSAHATPATPRRVHEIIALAGDDDAQATPQAGPAGADVDAGADAFEIVEGQRFLQRDVDGPDRQLRLAWCSPLTGACLLVNAGGAKAHLLTPGALRAMVRRSVLQPRDAGGAVAAVLQDMARQARAAG
ncbi:DUF1631 domain-containing protein [Luteimonas sp. BDR2-5]|uniref:DUF1631 family protein n=1 Tax=Proluteimonas luteida TaxID=2878685 RepID=UPI001E344EBE|nr:DUF1631 family protein [Luteimonas sp. BDR2-5]MCD9028937.1 DUF1631 domain-containing protein [Luteimonas sp. BDR2-5]